MLWRSFSFNPFPLRYAL